MSITKDVSVRLSTQGADKVKAELTEVSETASRLGKRTAVIEIDAHDDDFMVKASEVLEEAKELGATNVRVMVSADTERAKLAMDDIRLKADELGLDRVNIKVSIDQTELDASLAEAEAKVSIFRRSMNGLGSGLMSGGIMSGLGESEGVGILGPAIGAGIGVAPAAIAGAGGLLALAAPLAGAILGYTKLTAAQTASTAADKALKAEQQTVADATGKVSKATQQKLAADEKAAAAADKNTKALKSQYGAVATFMKGLKTAEGVFEKWSAPLSKPIFAALDKGLGLIKPLLKDITPAVKAMTPLVGQLVGFLGKSIKGGAIQDFFQWVAQNAPSSLKAIFQLVGAVTGLIGALVKGVGVQNADKMLQGLASVISGLSPVVYILARVLGDVFGWVFKNRAAMVVFGVVLAAIGGPVTTVVGLLIALGAAISWVTGHWKTIKQVTLDVWHAVTGAVSDAIRAIVGFFESLWRAVSNDVGKVDGFMRALPGKILSAVAGFGKLLWDAGVHLIEGLINGAKSMIGGVVGTLKNMASSAVNAVKGFFGIHSPSTVFHEIGLNLGQGLINGITEIAPKIVATIKKVIGQAKSYAQGVTSNALSGAGLSNITDPNGGNVTASEITSGLRGQLSTIRQFGSDLRKLKSRGLSGAALQQIIAMGPTQGLQYAQAILSAGIEGQVSRLIGSESSAATSLGNEAATDVYGRRIERLLTKLSHTLENSKSEINFNGIVTDPDAVARKIQQLLLDYKRHNGNRSLGLT